MQFEARGAGRVPQEMAKSRRNDGGLCPYPDGISPGLMKYKMAKTEAVVGARMTQVLRTEVKPEFEV
ncbi:hypothetical protein COT75_01060 [Candidatus Beckwithbacteria bacterium CG10_big_fil_rev_8_21_14_0_10_34_10]|uniref:Uncharacterized protein n=1 Tax=Candidatus Beckwithbacteria bacterium CG10_big_fil_rev_8_21_14_0_10_34_10 TaxID=1974495 RepID=A0A2H0WC97_9BACT|nr:MAG: hypothetical protein COT75_01060 [Candidatus Beckwithbacteria bacterium CG10_big_fil_rev_8_21_14_0_10_34_10]